MVEAGGCGTGDKRMDVKFVHILIGHCGGTVAAYLYQSFIMRKLLQVLVSQCHFRQESEKFNQCVTATIPHDGSLGHHHILRKPATNLQILNKLKECFLVLELLIDRPGRVPHLQGRSLIRMGQFFNTYKGDIEKLFTTGGVYLVFGEQL